MKNDFGFGSVPDEDPEEEEPQNEGDQFVPNFGVGFIQQLFSKEDPGPLFMPQGSIGGLVLLILAIGYATGRVAPLVLIAFAGIYFS